MNKPQWERVLDYLHTYGSITTVDAVRNMFPAVLRLSERIREIEAKGYSITHGRMTGNRCAKYTLKKVGQLPLLIYGKNEEQSGAGVGIASVEEDHAHGA